MMTKNTLIKVISTLYLVFSFQLAFAVVPPTMNYQGHLTDSGGVPIDGSVNMTFRIYDFPTSTAALWSDTLLVVVDQGVFSVELGSSTAPLPSGLFENPLWMGLTVGTDAEMTPRRAISSVGFSFKAGDADTLDGISASTLDQSAHVTDTVNPHSVTATQVGAADAATLLAHTGNTSNPHSVSAAQTGAVTSVDYTNHTSNTAAHHFPYSDAAAVIAMGTKSDVNTLNHDKYTDPNAVAAILAADGAGSTLDSDKVDGLEASEIIDAAQDEVRTPISSLPFTINTSGSYYVTGNLDGSSSGININVDDVTLDLMGFTLDGGGTVSDFGINLDTRSNITIHNGTIRGFGFAGVFQGNNAARYARVIDVRVLGNGSLGNSAAYSGIYLAGSNHLILRCTAGDNGYYGLHAGDSSLIKDSTAYSNQSTGIHAFQGSTLINNTAYSNQSTGIHGSWGSTLNNNTAYSNQSHGIHGAEGSTLSNNTAYSNQFYGIFGGAGSTLSNNTAYFNQSWGIYASGSNTVRSNTAFHNNQAQTANVGGIRIVVDSLVINNNADSNYHTGIYVAGGDSVLRNNHVTDSIAVDGISQCIDFGSSDNVAIGNTATGCNTEFAGTLPSAGRFIDNIGW